MKIEVRSVAEKVMLLKNKPNLRNVKGFDRIFLRSSQSHMERLMDINFRTILSEIPHGKSLRITRNGRIVKRVGDDTQSAKKIPTPDYRRPQDAVTTASSNSSPQINKPQSGFSSGSHTSPQTNKPLSGFSSGNLTSPQTNQPKSGFSSGNHTPGWVGSQTKDHSPSTGYQAVQQVIPKTPSAVRYQLSPGNLNHSVPNVNSTPTVTSQYQQMTPTCRPLSQNFARSRCVWYVTQHGIQWDNAMTRSAPRFPTVSRVWLKHN